MMRLTRTFVLMLSFLLLGWALGPPAALFAESVTVTSANPNNAPQGTINLNVLVNGNGFKKGAISKFFVSGTTNPGGITINSTTFINSNQLNANINVASGAVVSSYDIVVTLTNGATGKGSQLFSVTQGGSNNNNACPSTPAMLTTTNNCTALLPGCLDTTFAGIGIALTNTEGGLYNTKNTEDQAYTPLVQADGKIVAVGHDKDAIGNLETAIVRYNSDGSLDTTFGVGGILHDKIINGWGDVGELQPDGKILVAGASSGNSMAVARFLPDGILDATFGSGGYELISFACYHKTHCGAGASAIALQGDGKILLGGTGTVGWTILRLDTNGTLDTTFGNQGVIALNLGDSLRGLATQTVMTGTVTQERIVAVGGSEVVGLTPTGSLDMTFGPKLDGTASTTCNSPSSVAIDAANNIVVAGAQGLDFALSRFTPNGLADTTFGDPVPGSSARTGFTSVNFFDYNVWSRGLAIQSDGKLLVSGTAAWPNTAANLVYFYFGLARFNPDGTLDSSFGTGGVVATGYGTPPGNDFGNAVALQSDGKILMVGSMNPNDLGAFAVARYLP